MSDVTVGTVGAELVLGREQWNAELLATFGDVEKLKAAFDGLKPNMAPVVKAFTTIRLELDNVTKAAARAAEALDKIKFTGSSADIGKTAVSVDALGLSGQRLRQVMEAAAPAIRAASTAIGGLGRSAASAAVKLDALNLNPARIEAGAVKAVSAIDSITAAAKTAQGSLGSLRVTPSQGSPGGVGASTMASRAGMLVRGGETLMGAGALALAPLAAAAVATAGFDKAVQDAAFNANMTGQAVANLAANVKSLAAVSDKPISDIANAFMRAANFGYEDANALKVVTAANDAAIATGANLEDVTQALAQAMHQFHAPVEDASNVMNLLHYVAGATNQTLQDFVSSSGRGFEAATTLGVGMADAAAVMGVFTKNGYSAAQSQTALRAIIKGIVDPSSQARKEIQHLSETTGVDLVHAFSASGLAANGLGGVLDKVQEATKGNADVLFKLFTDQRNAIPTLALLTSAHGDYIKVLQGAEQAYQQNDLAEKQAEERKKSLSYDLGNLRDQAELTAATFGNDMKPQLDGLIEQMKGFLKSLNDLSPAQKAAIVDTLGLAGAVGVLGGAALTLFGKLGQVIGAIGTLIGKIPDAVRLLGGLKDAMIGADTAQAAIATDGIAAFATGGAYMVALGLVAAAVWAIKDHWDQAKQAQIDYEAIQQGVYSKDQQSPVNVKYASDQFVAAAKAELPKDQATLSQTNQLIETLKAGGWQAIKAQDPGLTDLGAINDYNQQLNDLLAQRESITKRIADVTRDMAGNQAASTHAGMQMQGEQLTADLQTAEDVLTRMVNSHLPGIAAQKEKVASIRKKLDEVQRALGLNVAQGGAAPSVPQFIRGAGGPVPSGSIGQVAPDGTVVAPLDPIKTGKQIASGMVLGIDQASAVVASKMLRILSDVTAEAKIDPIRAHEMLTAETEQLGASLPPKDKRDRTAIGEFRASVAAQLAEDAKSVRDTNNAQSERTRAGKRIARIYERAAEQAAKGAAAMLAGIPSFAQHARAIYGRIGHQQPGLVDSYFGDTDESMLGSYHAGVIDKDAYRKYLTGALASGDVAEARRDPNSAQYDKGAAERFDRLTQRLDALDKAPALLSEISSFARSQTDKTDYGQRLDELFGQVAAMNDRLYAAGNGLTASQQASGTATLADAFAAGQAKIGDQANKDFYGQRVAEGGERYDAGVMTDPQRLADLKLNLQLAAALFGEFSSEALEATKALTDFETASASREADALRQQLDKGQISLKAYVAGLEAIRATLPVTSEEYQRLGDVISQVSDKAVEDARRKWERLGDSIGAVLSKVIEGKERLGKGLKSLVQGWESGFIESEMSRLVQYGAAVVQSGGKGLSGGNLLGALLGKNISQMFAKPKDASMSVGSATIHVGSAVFPGGLAAQAAKWSPGAVPALPKAWSERVTDAFGSGKMPSLLSSLWGAGNTANPIVPSLSSFWGTPASSTPFGPVSSIGPGSSAAGQGGAGGLMSLLSLAGTAGSAGAAGGAGAGLMGGGATDLLSAAGPWGAAAAIGLDLFSGAKSGGWKGALDAMFPFLSPGNDMGILPKMLFKGFADGGHRPAGHPSWVGERGPELSIPRAPSTIISNRQVMSAVRAASGVGGSGEGRGHTFNFIVKGDVNGVEDLNKHADKMAWNIMQQLPVASAF